MFRYIGAGEDKAIMGPSGIDLVLALITSATNATSMQDPMRNYTEYNRDLGSTNAAFTRISSERCGNHVQIIILLPLCRLSLHCESYSADGPIRASHQVCRPFLRARIRVDGCVGILIWACENI